MKNRNLRKYGTKIAVFTTGLTGAFMSLPAMAEADAGIVTAATAGLTNAGDTAKGVYLGVIGALVVIIAVTWAISALRSSKRG